MGRSAKQPTMEKLLGDRRAVATLSDELQWSVVVTGGAKEFDSKVEAILLSHLNDATEMAFAERGFGPADGWVKYALFSYVADFCGWAITDAATPDDDRDEKPGVQF